MITVVKRGSKTTGVVRFSIGRASSRTCPGCVPAHALGNPFGVKPHGPHERSEAIALYEGWLQQKIAERNAAVCTALNAIWKAARQGDVELECFCVPLPCHGEVIKRVVERKL